ncbi:MAG: DUF6263 family protein [Cellulophaga sp.]
MKHIVLFLYFSLTSIVTLGQSKLQYNLNKGKVFTIKQTAQQIITQQIDSASHIITNNISGVLEFKVIEEINDNYKIALSFKDLNLDISSSIQGVLMSVKAKEVIEGDMQSKIFNAILNTPVEIILSKTGNILEATGGDSLVNKMTFASGLEDKFSLNMMRKSLEKEFGSEALSNSYKQLTHIYTEEKVSVGETWENEYQGKLTTKNSWTLDKLTETNATISGKATVIMNVVDPATTMKLSGTQETSITTDIASGFILKMKVEGFSEGFSTSVQMGNIEIPTTISSTITYELIKE